MQTKINYKFRIPFSELCPKCKEIILQKKKEQKRLNNRKFMTLYRAVLKDHSKK